MSMEGGKQGRSHSWPTFTKHKHPRVSLTHLCVPHSSVVPFLALSLCNGTIIRHTERRNAVFLRFWRRLPHPSMKIATTLNPQMTNASEFGRFTRTSLIDTPTHYMCNRCRKPLNTIHRSLMIVEAHKVRKSITIDLCQRFCRTESTLVIMSVMQMK